MFLNFCWWQWRWTNDTLLSWAFKQKLTQRLPSLKAGAHFSRMHKNPISREVKYSLKRCWLDGCIYFSKIPVFTYVLMVPSHLCKSPMSWALMHPHTITEAGICTFLWQSLLCFSLLRLKRGLRTCFLHVSVHLSWALLYYILSSLGWHWMVILKTFQSGCNSYIRLFYVEEPDTYDHNDVFLHCGYCENSAGKEQSQGQTM